VDFRKAVRVIWPGEVSGVIARAVNLSTSGILVDAPTPTPCPVGSDVLCDVALPGGPRLLRGRVAHRRLLPSEKVGMGIEFIDLSPREAAELRDVVGEGEERPQRVKVRFRGTNQIVSARAVVQADGFRLATALPFLKPETEVDIALSPDASVSARGRVSLVALERPAGGGAPRLIIDVRVADAGPRDVRVADAGPSDVRVADAGPRDVRVEAPASLDLRLEDADRTPVVNTLKAGQAVPEYVWEADEVGATAEPAPLGAPDGEDHVPTLVTGGTPPPAASADAGAIPAVAGGDLTEIVTFGARPRRWRALGGGMIAGLIAFSAFVVAIALMKTEHPRASVPSIAPPVIVTEKPAAPAPEPLAAPAAPEAEAVAAPPPTAPAVEAAPAEEPGTLVVDLSGSLAGVKRYPLSKPDGVAFNLPRAHTSKRLGTYTPDIPGLKSVWVRALPGGGTHLRFYFASTLEAPRVVLERDGVRVGAR
jgi:hypothetical protein